MSNYRRLISYIYAYEGGVKGKNIGYAKVEVRSGQCRIYVNVKKIYVGRNDIGVYLLTPSAEIFLGRIFIRGGSGEFRVTVAADKVDGKSVTLDQCYGLTIHDAESCWQSYTTIWEDAVAQAAEIELAEVTAENVRRQNQAAGADEGKESRTGIDLTEPYGFPVSREIERELEQEDTAAQTMVKFVLPEVQPEVEMPGVEVPGMQPNSQMPEERTEEHTEEHTEEQTEAEMMTRQSELETPDVPPETEMQTVQPELKMPEIQPNSQAPDEQPKQECVVERPKQPEPSGQEASSTPPDPEDPARLAELDRQEQAQTHPNQFWNRMQQRYARVLAFDYEKGCEILSIKPQDIGLLPREIWVYGNNSFLLHGYYNYRHLILARLDNPQGEPRYLLGVPGHYFSNEKYMATMFGFPHFVIARKQPDGDGRFGYWYTDIKL